MDHYTHPYITRLHQSPRHYFTRLHRSPHQYFTRLHRSHGVLASAYTLSKSFMCWFLFILPPIHFNNSKVRSTAQHGFGLRLQVLISFLVVRAKNTRIWFLLFHSQHFVHWCRMPVIEILWGSIGEIKPGRPLVRTRSTFVSDHDIQPRSCEVLWMICQLADCTLGNFLFTTIS